MGRSCLLAGMRCRDSWVSVFLLLLVFESTSNCMAKHFNPHDTSRKHPDGYRLHLRQHWWEGRAFMARGSSLVLRSALVSNTQQRDTNIDYDEDDGAFKFTGVFVSVGSTASVIAEVRRMLL